MERVVSGEGLSRRKRHDPGGKRLSRSAAGGSGQIEDRASIAAAGPQLRPGRLLRYRVEEPALYVKRGEQPAPARQHLCLLRQRQCDDIADDGVFT